MSTRLTIGKRLFQTVIGGLLLCLLAVATLTPTQAAINKQVNFQGRLTDANGNIVLDGDYNVEFKLHDHATNTGGGQGTCSGSCLWSETRTGANKVTVSRGLFSIQLGEVAPLTSFNFNQDPLYLSVRIGGTGTPAWDPEMTPRHRLGAAPQAIYSADSDLLDGLTSGNASGNIPISNGTLNTNLNADLLDGQSGAFYQDAGNLNVGTLLSARLSGSYTGITGTGALNAGSITSGFGAIDVGADNITTTGIISGGDLTATAASGKTTLELTSTGTDTGLTIGGDTTLYRSAADTLKTDDKLAVATLGTADTNTALCRNAALEISSCSSGIGASGARIYHNASQSIVNITSVTLAFNSERFDTDSYHSTASNTSRMTIPTAGIYQLNANVGWDSGSSVGMRQIGFFVNGTTYIEVDERPQVTGFSASQGVSTSHQFASGDYVEVVLYQNSGGTRTTYTSASQQYSQEFSIFKVSGGISDTLQQAYDQGATIATADSKDLAVTLANTTTDSNFKIDVATGSTGALKVQNNGTDVLNIGSAGQLALGAQGSTGGILLGGDTNLYREAADQLKTDDQLVASKGFVVDDAAPLQTVLLSYGGGAGRQFIWNKLQAADTQYAFRSFGDGKMEWGPGGSTAPDTNLYRSAADTLKTDDSFYSNGEGNFIGVDAGTESRLGFVKKSGALPVIAGGSTSAIQFGHWSTANLLGNVGSGTFTRDLAIETDGKLTFGTAADTNLYRGAADSLRSDDEFLVNRSAGGSTAVGVRVSGDSVNRWKSQADGVLIWGDGTVQDTNLYRSAANTLKTDDTFAAPKVDVQSSAAGSFIGGYATGDTVVNTDIFRARMDATGNTTTSFFTATSDDNGTSDVEFRLRGDGTGFSDGGWTTPGADYAEYVEKTDHAEPIDRGGVVGVKNGKVSRQTVGADMVMVVSTKPGMTGGNALDKQTDRSRDQDPNYLPVAFVGQVPVNVIGVVHSGDYLVATGRNDGLAIAKARTEVTAEDYARGVVGVAWESSDQTDEKHINTAILDHFGQPLAVKQALEPGLGQAQLTSPLASEVKELKVADKLVVGTLVVDGNAVVNGDLVLSDDRKGANVQVKKGEKKYQVKFKQAQQDTTYIVQVEQSWFSSTAIKEKTADGFVIEFDKKAPQDATIDWLIVR